MLEAGNARQMSFCSVLGITYTSMLLLAIHVGMNSRIHPHLVVLLSLVISRKDHPPPHPPLSHQCDEVKGYTVIRGRKLLGCDCLK